MYKVYLAGPIDSLTWNESNSWREFIEVNVLPQIKTLSPLRGKGDYLSKMDGKGDLAHTRIAGSYSQYPLSTPAAIIGRDRWDATRCDVLFVNLLGAQKVSMGTVMEIAWADLARIPIMLVMEDTGNIHEHSMVTGVCTWRVNNLETAVDLLNKILTP